MGNFFTFAGKALVFATLVLGIGIATLSTTVYSQRPGWFDPAPESGVDKGHSPLSFPVMTAEINESGKAAVAASTAWGAELQALQEAEKLRDERRNKMFGPGGLLEIAQKGAPVRAGDPPGPGFYQLKIDEATGLLDLDDRSTVVTGPNGQPLKGAETLLATYTAHADEIDRLIRESSKLRRDDLKRLGDEIVLTETRFLKQRDIREQLANEAAYLASLEINVTEQQATATRRRDQLLRRLDDFGMPKKKGPPD